MFLRHTHTHTGRKRPLGTTVSYGVGQLVGREWGGGGWEHVFFFEVRKGGGGNMFFKEGMNGGCFFHKEWEPPDSKGVIINREDTYT